MVLLLVTLTAAMTVATLRSIAHAAANQAVAGAASADEEQSPGTVHLVFVTHGDRGELVLDCVSEANGWPFTVCVAWTPPVEYAGLFIDAVLEQWAMTGADLDMQFVDGSDGPEVSVRGPDSRVRLPLAT